MTSLSIPRAGPPGSRSRPVRPRPQQLPLNDDNRLDRIINEHQAFRRIVNNHEQRLVALEELNLPERLPRINAALDRIDAELARPITIPNPPSRTVKIKDVPVGPAAARTPYHILAPTGTFTSNGRSKIQKFIRTAWGPVPGNKRYLCRKPHGPGCWAILPTGIQAFKRDFLARYRLATDDNGLISIENLGA